MSRAPSVVKVGGSLLADRGRLGVVLRALAADEAGCILVPGGGPFAEAVRAAQAALGFSDALAHRLALDAMGRMAEVFCEIAPRLSVEREVAALARGSVWDPQALKAGRPDIPETWDVTSDSLALWLATRLGAPACVLLKSIDPPRAADAAALGRLGLVDAAFPAFAARYPGSIVVRGPGAETVVAPAAGRAAA